MPLTAVFDEALCFATFNDFLPLSAMTCRSAGAAPGGEHRPRSKKRGVESFSNTDQPHIPKSASDSLSRKKSCLKHRRSTQTCSHSDQTAEAISEYPQVGSGALQPNQLKQRAQQRPSGPKEESAQQLQWMKLSEYQCEARGDIHGAFPRTNKKKKRRPCVSSSLLSAASTADAGSGTAAGDATQLVSPRNYQRASSGSSIGKDDGERGTQSAAGSSGAKRKAREADAQSLGDTVDLVKDSEKKKKRKRRDCWDVATVTEQKSRLLQVVQDSRDQLSKSRLKRLKARLSLLAKAERGEVQVGGQLMQSEKRRKLVEKIRRKKKEGRKKAVLHGSTDKGKRRTWNEKTRDNDRTDPDGSSANEKRIKKICLNCRKRGHLLENCPVAVSAKSVPDPDKEESALTRDTEETLHPAMSGICFNCGSREHTLKNCKKPRRPDGVLPFVLCFVCGKGGHMSSQCPDSKTGKYPKGGCCRTCGSIFHLQAECPDFKDRQATKVAAGGNASYANDITGGSRRGPKQRKVVSLPGTMSRLADQEVDPDEYWGS